MEATERKAFWEMELLGGTGVFKVIDDGGEVSVEYWGCGWVRGLKYDGPAGAYSYLDIRAGADRAILLAQGATTEVRGPYAEVMRSD